MRTDPQATVADANTEEDAADDAIETRAHTVGEKEHGTRLDKVLVGVAGEFSRNQLQSLIERGCVQVDGITMAQPSRKLRLGQRVEVALVPTAESQAFRAEAMVLDVVFEDAHLLVVNKPAGLVVHPAAGHWSGTLLNGLLAWHPGASTLARAGIVHRLDKDTTGLMVVAKTLITMTALTRAIAARDVHREYLAIAHGLVSPMQFSVEQPIGRDPRTRVRMAVVTTGKAARTDFECIASAAGATALRCVLHSGRTHQIRVHLSFIGHPLVGDEIYGGRPLLGLQRQALHAARLRLAHPVTGAALDFACAPPLDFQAAWATVSQN